MHQRTLKVGQKKLPRILKVETILHEIRENKHSMQTLQRLKINLSLQQQFTTSYSKSE